ncbi:MAG: hypothetical protein JWM87_1442 [Candidatus Eremiobacteraeota bacterium]|nr:hypothetical protein [Candidatus Eremiobacteraeota bacterium]
MAYVITAPCIGVKDGSCVKAESHTRRTATYGDAPGTASGVVLWRIGSSVR